MPLLHQYPEGYYQSFKERLLASRAAAKAANPCSACGVGVIPPATACDTCKLLIFDGLVEHFLARVQEETPVVEAQAVKPEPKVTLPKPEEKQPDVPGK